MSSSITALSGCNSIKSIPFRTYAEKFEYIKSDTIGIVIDRDDKSHDFIKQIQLGDMSIKRKLQRYTVSVYRYELDEILKLGIAREYGGVYILENTKYYSGDKGLLLGENNDETYIC